MAGREQKAREGKWNGGFAPYGYKLENGELVIAEDEVEIIRMIFDRYIHTNDGINMIIYTTEDGLTKVETTFDGDTVWLSIDQMAELFQRDKSTISRHIKNIFTEGELQRDSVVAKFATTASDGKIYNVDYYNYQIC